jgi:hypothetical protein
MLGTPGRFAVIRILPYKLLPTILRWGRSVGGLEARRVDPFSDYESGCIRSRENIFWASAVEPSQCSLGSFSLTWLAATGGVGDLAAETGSTGIDTMKFPEAGLVGQGSLLVWAAAQAAYRVDAKPLQQAELL